VAELRREIGFWTAVSIVVGNMIGSGVFLLPASLAPYGGLSLLGWGVSAAGSVLLALVFARLARANPAAGGPYAYSRLAFGDLTGFLVGWGYWVSTWCTNAALAVAFVSYLEPFLPSIVHARGSATAVAISAIWLFSLVNVRGVGTAGRVQLVTTVLKAMPLAVVGLAGLAAFNADAFTISQSGTAMSSDLMAVVTLTLWAFLGLECATIPAASVRNPDRVIPLATVTGTLIAAGVYIVSTVGVMSLLPHDELVKSSAPFADAARTFGGTAAASLVAIGAAISCLGALNGWTLIVGQLPMAMAADGVFPAAFRRLSARGTPAAGIVIGAVLSTLLILVDLIDHALRPIAQDRNLVSLFTRMILIATLSTLVPYFFCSLAVLVRGGRAAGGPSRMAAGGRVVAALALLYSVVAIIGAGVEVLIWGAGLLLVGLPVYFWMASRRIRSHPA
jgi:APA family basic amino acid/polyamine antiporter